MRRITYVIRASEPSVCGRLEAAQTLEACSACGGDYEDPERTAPLRHVPDPSVVDGDDAEQHVWPADAAEED